MAPKRGRQNLTNAVASQVTNDTVNQIDALEVIDSLAIRTMAERDMLAKLAKAVTYRVADEAVSKHCVLKVIDSLAAIGWDELVTIGRFNIPGLLRMTDPPPPLLVNEQFEDDCLYPRKRTILGSSVSDPRNMLNCSLEFADKGDGGKDRQEHW